MKTYLECFPCAMRQSLEAVAKATSDETLREEVLRRTSLALSSIDLNEPSPVMIGIVHRIVREVTCQEDPYLEARGICNRNVMVIYPEMKKMIRQSADPIETGLRLAIAANTIDFVVDVNADQTNILEMVQQALSAPMNQQTVGYFREAVNRARKVLYLGDNAGEIVFDRLLIEELPAEKISYVVKGRPVVNDVTVEDAAHSGMNRVVNIISNGSGLPGTVLYDCSDAFRDNFREADLIISKGQGNYESLEGIDKNIFFLFKTKCNVIRTHLGYEIGSLVILSSQC